MITAITGVSGHVGGNLVRALIDQGQRPRVLVHEDTRAIDGLDVERIPGDVRDPDSLRALVDGAERVFHLAAHITLLNDWTRLEETNVRGTRNLVAACLDAGVKQLVHTASIEALLYPDCRRPVREAAPPDPQQLVTAYGRSKALGVQAVREGIERGLDAVIVAPTAVIGPWDFKPSNFGQMFIDFARRKLPSLVPGGFDLVDVRDLVTGMLAAADRGRTGEMYLLSGEYVTVAQIAAMLAGITAVAAPRLTTPLWLARFAALFTPPYYRLSGARPRFTSMSINMLAGEYRVSHDKATAELDYQPRPVREGIEAAVAWFREHGFLSPSR